ncbi:dihydrodipicolinate synthase family protein [Streptomyces gamaensis]|uniref:Dihydrodipicolinate synthase family protein n=1 Tax=Streptomyces gamaensis TaxID=1763542 RepID=A0ABW0YS94_9ACTN
MTLPEQLTGVVPPLCTPLTASGEVDTRSLAALVEHVVRAGAGAVFALGSSGEAAFLTGEQRRTVLEATVEAAAGRVPVLAGVIDTTTPRVLEHARAAAALGADALVATAPFYMTPHPAETADHFRRIRAAVDLPLLAYDIPPAVHGRLAPQTVLALAGDGTLAGLKDSSGDLEGLRRLLVALRDTGRDAAFSVLTGSQLAVDAALLAGAQGVVPGLGNVDPAGYVRLYGHARSGRWEEAAAEQDRLARLFAILEAGDPAEAGPTARAIGGFKAALHLLGVIASPATATPQHPLSQASVRGIERLLKQAGLL